MNEQSTGVTSTEQTSFIDSLRQAPAGTEGDVALFHVFWNYAALFVAAIHVSWVLLFWLRDVPPLAYLNIINQVNASHVSSISYHSLTHSG